MASEKQQRRFGRDLKFTFKWIQMQQIAFTGKTDVWQIAARDFGPTILGTVKWFGRWRKYCFFPELNTVFEQDCLRDIATFCESLTEKHRFILAHSRSKEKVS